MKYPAKSEARKKWIREHPERWVQITRMAFRASEKWNREHPEQVRERARLAGVAGLSGENSPKWRGGRVGTLLRGFEATNDGSCWLWHGSMNNDGYGRIKGVAAHRLSYELFREPIPQGMEIDHTCHDPRICKLKKNCPHRRCVNPWHMRVVTTAENLAASRRYYGT